MNRLITSTALALALGASAAYAQTSGTQAQQSPAMNQPSQSGAGSAMQQADEYMAKAAVVSVGGFLGIGDKHVAVPWNEVQVGADTGGAERGTSASGSAGGGATGSGSAGSAAAARDPVLRVNMTKEQLQQAPEFQTSREQARGSRGTSPAGSGSGSDTAPQRGTSSPSR
jgi:hypothetical protein